MASIPVAIKAVSRVSPKSLSKAAPAAPCVKPLRTTAKTGSRSGKRPSAVKAGLQT